ncbi:AtpZ/AtpI family protein [Mesonia sp. K7]|uniref:AtpZ/AtpI family protein n=1 Tax=Mesonia sp. K7 TaxID=2218606 RepID=UPI0018F17D46|nr:AtpZ/AtpI family protein [Mesonia sp. K7]
MSQDQNNKKNKRNKQLKNFALMSGVAIQMGITIYLFVILGKWLDDKMEGDGKLFLIIGTLLGVAISIFVVLRQLKKINEE